MESLENPYPVLSLEHTHFTQEDEMTKDELFASIADEFDMARSFLPS